MTNFLLVHGGMAGGWCWKKVRECLERKNHAVLTPTLTGLGERKHLTNQNIDLDVHIHDILNTVFYEDWENVVLVGHSYAGMIITAVADLIPQKIKKLIYVDAVLPKEGESMFDIVDPKIVSYLYNSVQEKGAGWEVPPASPESYGLTDSKDMQWFAARCTPHPLKSFQKPLCMHTHCFEKVDKMFIKCVQDSALDWMLDRAKDMGIAYYLLDTGHFPMITHPEKLTELLLYSD